jgi:catechol 2,3-dioxygenase-like lactoylglutathione lyase family enzyme
MNVKGIAWLGSPTDRYDEMRRFAVDVLGLRPRIDQTDFAVFDLPDGDVFEIFGPRALADEHQFMRGPVAGFLVDDVAAARAEMETKGVLFIGPLHGSSEEGGWSHFFGPDGHVYEITSRPK